MISAVAAESECREPTDGIPGRSSRFLVHVPYGIPWAAIVPQGWADYARWFVGNIVFQRFRIHELTAEDWCPMAAEFCEAFLPTRVRRKLIDALVKARVIECDQRYWPPRSGRNGRCKHYRLGKKYRDVRIIAHELKNPELLRRIRVYQKKERELITDGVHIGLRVWVDRIEVDPDAPFGDPVLDRVRSGDLWFCVCDQGRVHTPATNLARWYRQYVRLAGHELVAVDVSCSQPLLLGVTLRSVSAILGVVNPRPGIPFVLHCQESEANVEMLASKCDSFLQDCLEGVLYDRLAESLGVGRDQSKVELFGLIYGAPYRYDRGKAERFAAIYPQTWQRVLSLAYGLYERGGELARRMQSVESALMIQGVAGRFLREYPDVPVLTCHDALLVPPDAAGRAREIILAEWHRQYGIRPRVKVTPWTCG